jgi:hypothetical protein
MSKINDIYYNSTNRDIILKGDILMPKYQIKENKIYYIERKLPIDLVVMLQNNTQEIYIKEKKDEILTISFENYNNDIEIVTKKKNKISK